MSSIKTNFIKQQGFYERNDCIRINTSYIAFIDGNYIKNSKGDKILIDLVVDNNIDPIEFFHTYESIKTNDLSFNNDIILTKDIILLVGNSLYDVLGREIILNSDIEASEFVEDETLETDNTTTEDETLETDNTTTEDETLETDNTITEDETLETDNTTTEDETLETDNTTTEDNFTASQIEVGDNTTNISDECFDYKPLVYIKILSAGCFNEDNKKIMSEVDVITVDFNEVAQPICAYYDYGFNETVKIVKNSKSFFRSMGSPDGNILESADCWNYYGIFLKDLEEIDGIDVSKGYLYLDPFLNVVGNIRSSLIDYEDFPSSDTYFNKSTIYAIDSMLYNYAYKHYVNLKNEDNYVPIFKNTMVSKYEEFVGKVDLSYINSLNDACNYLNNELKYYINNIGNIFTALVNGDPIYVINQTNFVNISSDDSNTNTYSYYKGHYLEISNEESLNIVSNSVVQYDRILEGNIGLIFENGIWSFNPPNISNNIVEKITWNSSEFSYEEIETYVKPRDVD
jgi:hypothetical protein